MVEHQEMKEMGNREGEAATQLEVSSVMETKGNIYQLRRREQRLL